MQVGRRIVAVALGSGLLLGCAHTRPASPLADIEQLLAHAVFIAIQVPEPSPIYEVALPPEHDSQRILRAAALEAGFKLSVPERIVRPGKTVGPVARVRVGEPAWIEGTTPREARVAFAYGLGEGALVECVLRIRLYGTSSRTWRHHPEGQENCWPRPKA